MSFLVNIGEYWLEGIIKNMVGYFDVSVSIFGFFGEFYIDGEIKVCDGVIIIDFL